MFVVITDGLFPELIAVIPIAAAFTPYHASKVVTRTERVGFLGREDNVSVIFRSRIPPLRQVMQLIELGVLRGPRATGFYAVCTFCIFMCQLGRLQSLNQIRHVFTSILCG